MAEFVTVGNVASLGSGETLACVVDGEEVVVANCDGTLYAIGDVCSHAYAHLSEGDVDADDCTITCPLHGAEFDLRSGRPRTLPATRPVPVFQVQVVGDEIQVAAV